jgi:hypothetical protein
MRLDSAAWLAVDQVIAREGRDEMLLGTWHTHPGTSDARPSAADRSCWLGALEYVGATAHVGLIYTIGKPTYYGERSWATPQVSAWVTRRTRAGTPITEPASLRER